MKINLKDKKTILEIIRFLVVGVVATIFDFGAKTLTAYLLPTNMNDFLHFGIPLIVGFIVGVLVNYFLSILWVFQNVEDKKDTRSSKNFWKFILLGFIGLLIGLGIFYGSRYLILAISNNSIDINVGKDNISLVSIDFWCYFGVFCIQTLIVLVYNYLTRKKFIFKESKN